MGAQGRAFVRERFLLTRQVQDYLAVVHCLRTGMSDVVTV
jgi:hypothetical protein